MTASRLLRPLAAACAALGAALTLAGCEDVTAGQTLAEVYALRDVDGSAPPIVLSSSRTFDGRGTETIALLAAAFRFDGAGGARYVVTLRNTVDVPARDTAFTTTSDLAYWRVGDRIEIGSRTPCPPNALCAANFVGRVVGGRIEIETGTARPSRYVFEMVGRR